MHIYLGVEHAAKADWQDILGDPKKPANWKDETYEARKSELQAKQAEEAPEHLMAGYCPRVSIIVDKSAAVQDGGGPLKIEGCTVHDSVHTYMLTGDDHTIITALNRLVEQAKGEPVVIVGIETLDTLRQMAWSAAKDHTAVPGWMWNAGGVYDTVDIVNLYSCSGAKQSTSLSAQGFLNYWTTDAGEAVKAITAAYGLKRLTPAQEQAIQVSLTAARLGLA